MRIHCSTPPSSGLFDRFPHDFLIRFALRPLRASLRRGKGTQDSYAPGTGRMGRELAWLGTHIALEGLSLAF
jgi:hypothetical protein